MILQEETSRARIHGTEGDSVKEKMALRATRKLSCFQTRICPTLFWKNRRKGSDTDEKAEWTTTLFGADVKGRYAELKRTAADRCARVLGTAVKAPEVQFHHEVYNQFLWNLF